MEQIERRQITSDKRLERIWVHLKEGHGSSHLKSGAAVKSSAHKFSSGSGKLDAAAISGACSSHSLDNMTDGMSLKEEKANGIDNVS